MKPHQTQSMDIDDAVANHWIMSRAPVAIHPYLKLMRVDRPVGSWLLLWPCLWALALAARSQGNILPDPILVILFVIGTIIMRGAGCTYNDIIDHRIDAMVARTRHRPIPSGQVSLAGAWSLTISLCLLGLAILLSLNITTILIGSVSLLPVAIYPFMKRITWWPQLFLGLCFNWGSLLGWTAVTGNISPTALLCYVGGMFWTLGYDSIYALQDKEDDALIGIKSTALRLKSAIKPWLAAFYTAALISFSFAGINAGTGMTYQIALGVAAIHAAWQIQTLNVNDSYQCLIRFRSNRDFGGIIFIGIILDAVCSAVLGT